MIAAVMMVRDEEDIVGHTITNLLEQGVDRVYVADNLSVDATPEILAGFDDRVVVTVDDEAGYYQDRKMTELARVAAAAGFDWILPCDADEFWYHPETTVAEFLNSTDLHVIHGRGWDHIATDEDDPTEPNPFARIGHRRRQTQRMPKVVFRWHPDAWIDFGNHYVLDATLLPGDRKNLAVPTGNGLQFRHYQYRSFEQMTRKLRQGKDAYDATNLHPTFGAHWREMGAWDDERLWRKWRQLCEEPGLAFDPAPTR